LLPQQSKLKGQKTLKTHPTIIFKLQEFISWQPMYTFITDTRMDPSEVFQFHHKVWYIGMEHILIK
jgi:hypothetical protein